MTTRLGYMVDSLTGESVPVEDCLVVSPGGRRATVISKLNGRNMSDKNWVFVQGPDATAEEIMSHPSFRLKMMLAAADKGRSAEVLQELLFGRPNSQEKPMKEKS